MSCKICGAELSDEDQICPACGEPRELLLEEPGAQERARQAERVKLLRARWQRLLELERLAPELQKLADELHARVRAGDERARELEQRVEQAEREHAITKRKLAESRKQADAQQTALRAQIEHGRGAQARAIPTEVIRAWFQCHNPSEVTLLIEGVPGECGLMLRHHHLQFDRTEELAVDLAGFSTCVLIHAVTGDRIELTANSHVEGWLDGQKLSQAAVQYVEGILYPAPTERRSP